MTGLTQKIVWQHVKGLLPENDSQTPPALCVAFSGGLDSTVLLHVLAELHQKNPVHFSIRAIHINHQLQTEAAGWSEFCREFCEKRAISFQSICVEVVDSKKKGSEAAARQARYAAFEKALLPTDILLTAHHLDDQIETVFLQLLRGTGIEGAAAIAPLSYSKHYCLVRPLLTFERKQLLDYAKIQKLSWVDDPSNLETHFNRNYLRQKVLPILEKRWPAYRKTIQRFANHARAASSVLDDYLAEDFGACFDVENKTLNTDVLKTRVIEKRLMLIRYWIKHLNCAVPGEAVLLQIHAVIFAKEDSNPLVQWDKVQLRRYRNKLHLLPRETLNLQKISFEWDLKSTGLVEGLGTLNTQQMLGQGIHQRFLNAPAKIEFRQGGEKCSLVGRQGKHSLKKLFQEYAIPPWQRNRIPLLIIDHQIAAVVGLFYCPPFVVDADEVGTVITLKDRSALIFCGEH